MVVYTITTKGRKNLYVGIFAHFLLWKAFNIGSQAICPYPKPPCTEQTGQSTPWIFSMFTGGLSCCLLFSAHTSICRLSLNKFLTRFSTVFSPSFCRWETKAQTYIISLPTSLIWPVWDDNACICLPNCLQLPLLISPHARHISTDAPTTSLVHSASALLVEQTKPLRTTHPKHIGSDMGKFRSNS